MARLTATLLVCAALSGVARADGVVVPSAVVVEPARTPEQKALLRFDGATETLVIETTLQGAGRDFAWIVPLPAPPKVEASTTGLFPTLESRCAPKLDEGKKRGSDATWMVTAALGLGLWIAVRWWRRPLPPVVAVLAVPALVVATGLTVGGGCGQNYLKSADAPDSVAVLSREQVGAFDTATLDARDGAALRAWLDANGFRAPPSIDCVADEYAKEGWVFVASKVRRDGDDSETRRVHPLAFTFPSARAVYPMRLTGAANDSVALELFVTGDRRAEADGMTVEHCEMGPFPAPEDEARPMYLDFEHFDGQGNWTDEARLRCGGPRVLTKLTGVLDRAAMARDLEIRWTNFVPKEVVYLSEEVAFRRALSSGAWALAAALVVAAFVGRWRAVAAGSVATRTDVVALAVALCVGGSTTLVDRGNYALLPSGARVIAPSGPGLEHRLTQPPRAIRGDAAAIRAWVSAAAQGCINPWTSLPPREEDSPGNWTVREASGRIELVLYGHWPWGNEAIDLTRFVVLEGVVRAADGRTVAGAWVRLTDPFWKPATSDFFMYTVRTRTDGQGRYRMEFPAGRKWHVSVVHAEHPYLLREDVDLGDPSGAMDLVLPRERSLRGRVVDAARQPRSGVLVHGRRDSPFSTNDSDDTSTATTAADGTFELRGFDADAASTRVWLHVHRDGRCRGDGSKSFDLGPRDELVELIDDEP